MVGYGLNNGHSKRSGAVTTEEEKIRGKLEANQIIGPGVGKLHPRKPTIQKQSLSLIRWEEMCLYKCYRFLPLPNGQAVPHQERL